MNFTTKKTLLKRGFTLPELLVAMTITLILVSLTTVITGSAIDAWRGARTEIRAAGQAKVMLNALGRDLESMVIRMGTNESQWLIATSNSEGVGPDDQVSPNAVRLTFFTAASDRYNGNAGSNEKITGDTTERDADRGGDVSAVSYQLDFADPVWGDQSDRFSTFVLYRKLLDPDETYRSDVIGSTDLEQTFDVEGGVNDLADLVCENVYEFTITFVVKYKDADNNNELTTVSLPVMSTSTNSGADVLKSFAINGTGLAPDENSSSPFRGGRVSAVELAITVLSDEGVAILKKNPFQDDEEKAEFIEKKGFRYTRSVSLPAG